MPNVPLLEATMDYCLSHPEEHNQQFWVNETNCGTTRCFAGTAAMLAGYKFLYGDCQVADDDELRAGSRYGSPVATVREVAIRELKLTWEQADHLFHESRTIDELGQAVKDIVNEQQLQLV